MMMHTPDIFARAQRIVIKIGSSLVTESGSGKVRTDWLESLCADLHMLRTTYDAKVIVVSSGAVALGKPLLKTHTKLKLEEKQAAAACG
ncbi:MAG: hypothetical protein KDD76_07220 [Rickettsiales bacterium]|nr:hypothetical protein [Rickettsiales bacterium]